MNHFKEEIVLFIVSRISMLAFVTFVDNNNNCYSRETLLRKVKENGIVDKEGYWVAG